MRLANKTIKHGGLLLASLSMFGLVVGTYEIGLVAPFQAMNDFYHSVLRSVLSPLELAFSFFEFEPPEFWREMTAVVSIFSVRFAKRQRHITAWIFPPLSILFILLYPPNIEQLGTLDFIWFELDLGPLSGEIMAFSIVFSVACVWSFLAWVIEGSIGEFVLYLRSTELVMFALGDFVQIVFGALAFLAINAGLGFIGFS